MNPYLFTALVAAPVTFACMVVAGLLIRSDGWVRVTSLLLAIGALSVVAAYTLPGLFDEDEDIANGLLFFIWLIQSFWFSIAAVVWLSVLQRPVDWIIEKIQLTRQPSIKETFE